MAAKRQRMRNRILIRVLPAVAAVLLLLSWYNYQNMKDSLLINYDKQKQMAESHIVDAVTLIDSAYRALEIRLEAEMAVPGKALKSAYDAVGGDPNQLNLEALKKDFGSEFDFFIIDSNTVITHGTMAEGINFNFSAFDAELGEKINRIRMGDKIWYEQLRTNVVNGRLSKFSYIPVDDHSHLLEVSYSVGGFDRLIDELKPQNITEALTNISPLITSIRIFDAYGYQLVDSGENYKPTEEALKIIERATREKGFEESIDDTHTRKALFIELNSKRERTLANTDRIIEIVYDTSSINAKLSEMTNVSIGTMLVVLLGLCGSIILLARNLTRPIEALTAISGEISQGNYTVRASVEAEDEVKDLAESFNFMLDDINASFNEIARQNIALEEANQGLEEKVEARTREIILRNEELQEKNRELELAWSQANAATEAKSSFLAMISHEIRTPINGIVGMAYLMQRTKLTLRQRDYITKMKTSADTLLEIINDVLDISKLEAGKVTLEKVDFSLHEVLEQVSTQVSYRASEKGLELVVAADPAVPDVLVGDPLRLKQVLANLMNNAVKFTEAGEIVVTVKSLEKRQDSVRLRFSVSDTGVGIEGDKLERLFDPFQQADDSVTRKYGGTGLGLSICKRFVELMHGEIGVESQPNNGSTFYFTADFEMGTALPPVAETAALAEKSLNILVVDDSQTARETLTAMLHDIAAQIVTAASGDEALRLVEASNMEGNFFDLVLMDWKMPGLDGIETAAGIKQRQAAKRVPAILMLTGYDLDEARKHEGSGHIDAFLNKPVVRPALLQVIGNLVAGSKYSEYGATEKRLVLTVAEPGASIRILLAEDHPINQQILKEMLEQPQIAVDVVENGQKAVEAAVRTTYDMILMDIQMPEMDGLEAARQIRRNESGKRTPIVALTAHALKEDRALSAAAGMDDYMVKPVDEKVLYETLQKWIEKPLRIESFEMEHLDMEAGVLSVLQSFNTKSALRSLQGNQGKYLRLLADFLEAYRDTDETLKQLLGQKSFPEIRAIIHGIRGIAGNLGAMELFIVAQALEGDLVKGNAASIGERFEVFRQAFGQVLSEIQTVMSLTRHEQLQEEDLSSAQGMDALFAELRLLLKDGSSEAGHLIPALRQLLKESSYDAKVSELIVRIENFDFDDALHLLDSLKQELNVNGQA